MKEDCCGRNVLAGIGVPGTVLTLVSAWFLFRKTAAGTLLRDPASGKLLLEMAAVTALLTVSAGLCRKRSHRQIAWAAVILGFLWLHQILLPILAAGLYLAYLVLLGRVFCRTAGTFLSTARCLLLGASLQLVITAMFSAFGIGGTGFFRIQCLTVFLPLLVWHIVSEVKKDREASASGSAFEKFEWPDFQTGCLSDFRADCLPDHLPDRFYGFLTCLLPAFLTAALLLQAGRMNIALDYDSLHYGLRSAFVLDNGAGIYQNLGSVNDVYVYPKGLEALCLPLSGLAGGSFVTAVSWWLTLGSLWAVSSVVRSNSGQEQTLPQSARTAGFCAAVCICAIPGIMNMAASAKTDAATLFFQLLCIAEFSGALKRREPAGFLFGLAAAVFTLILKPTSYLFSLLPVLAALAAGLIFRKKTEPWNSGKIPKTAVFIAAAAVLAYGLITLRTVRIAGVPVTTAGEKLWQLLGFERKYPFAGLQAAGDEGQSLLKRLIGVFACPVGEEMSHVFIAWGGLLPAMCMLITVIRRLLRRRTSESRERIESRRTIGRAENCECTENCENSVREEASPALENGPSVFFLDLTLGLTLLASAACIAALYQVDGNYFMLLYALSVICAFSGRYRSTAPRRLLAVLLPPLALGAFMCCITNWAGVPGLTPMKLLHTGYVNQIELDRQEQEAQGTGELYGYLEARPTARVLAMMEQPACFVYRCNLQSYTDLEGSGGNVYLVKTLALFREFLDYAKEDCLLTDDAFLAGHSRAAEIVGYMLEDGSLTPVWEGGGKHLYEYHPGKQD